MLQIHSLIHLCAIEGLWPISTAVYSTETGLLAPLVHADQDAASKASPSCQVMLVVLQKWYWKLILFLCACFDL